MLRPPSVVGRCADLMPAAGGFIHTQTLAVGKDADDLFGGFSCLFHSDCLFLDGKSYYTDRLNLGALAGIQKC